MKIIPKIYGQDFNVFSDKQRYTGNITIVPSISFAMQFKPLTNPTPDDMAEYIAGGMSATFDKISRIQNSLLIEQTLDECIQTLEARAFLSLALHNPTEAAATAAMAATNANTTDIAPPPATGPDYKAPAPTHTRSTQHPVTVSLDTRRAAALAALHLSPSKLAALSSSGAVFESGSPQPAPLIPAATPRHSPFTPKSISAATASAAPAASPATATNTPT